MVRPEDIRQGGQGSWNHCLGFCTKDDNIVEGDESFYIIVSPHTNRVMPYQSSKDRLQVTIHDNDGMFPPTWQLLLLHIHKRVSISSEF